MDELLHFIYKNSQTKKQLEKVDSVKRGNLEKRSGFVLLEEFKKIINEAGRSINHSSPSY